MREGCEKRLFVAATNQNDGKTTTSLGLVKGFSKYAKRIGFIKPVAQRYSMVDGVAIDKELPAHTSSMRLPLCVEQCESRGSVQRVHQRISREP